MKSAMRFCVVTALLLSAPPTVFGQGQGETLPPYLRDRGTGVASSMFGTYIRKGDFIVYPYWEFYVDHNAEYKPAELGYGLDQDFGGRYRESEYLFFLAYGVTDWLGFQTELAGASASLRKSGFDTSGMPAEIRESGLSSFETQFRWRGWQETEHRPEFWGYVDIVYPLNRSAKIIGSNGWDIESGLALTRGYRWGTVTVRASAIYESASETKWDLGEYAVEYLKRLSPHWRLFFAVQGAGALDEASVITEAQWHLSPKMFIRFNQEIGLTSRSVDWEPQLGVLWTLPTLR